MAPCDTPIILDISLWERIRLENEIVFSINRGRKLVGMTLTLVWDSNLHTTTTHSWMWSTHMRHTAFCVIGEMSTREKEGRLELDKNDGWPEKSIRASRKTKRRHHYGDSTHLAVSVFWTSNHITCTLKLLSWRNLWYINVITCTVISMHWWCMWFISVTAWKLISIVCSYVGSIGV